MRKRGTTARDDLEAWAAARWPTLVRVALGLGAPTPVAVEVAAEALSRLRPRWHALRTQGDPDAEVLELVLAAWSDACAARWWERHPSTTAPEPLDALGRDERAELVLAIVGDVAGDRSSDAVGPARAVALRSVPVLAPAPTAAGLDALARRRRGRRTRRWAGGAVAATLALGLVAGLGWTFTRPEPLTEPRALSSVDVVLRPDPGARSVPWLTWYADGRLHLGGAVARIRGVEQVVDVAGAVVYADSAGRVVRLTRAGARTLLGRTDDPLSVVASDDGRLVGWVDGRRGRHLVVADASDGGQRRTLTLPTGPDHAADRLVAIGSGRVYVTGNGGSWSRPLDGAAADPSVTATLLAVAGDTVVYAPTADSGEVRVSRLGPDGVLPPPTDVGAVPGDEASLAPDAGYVLARTGSGQVLIRDLVSGRDLPSGVRSDEVALAAKLGTEGRVAYVVARAADRPQADDYVRSSFTGPTTVRTCVFARDLVTTACESVDQVSGTSANPLLAH